MKVKIVVKHYYQDPHNPSLQTMIVNADYPTMYALFNSLIDSHKDFSVELTKEQDKL